MCTLLYESPLASYVCEWEWEDGLSRQPTNHPIQHSFVQRGVNNKNDNNQSQLRQEEKQQDVLCWYLLLHLAIQLCPWIGASLVWWVLPSSNPLVLLFYRRGPTDATIISLVPGRPRWIFNQMFLLGSRIFLIEICPFLQGTLINFLEHEPDVVVALIRLWWAQVDCRDAV